MLADPSGFCPDGGGGGGPGSDGSHGGGYDPTNPFGPDGTGNPNGPLTGKSGNPGFNPSSPQNNAVNKMADGFGNNLKMATGGPVLGLGEAALEGAAGSGDTIALGVREKLGDFAEMVGGKTWHIWGKENFQSEFSSVMSDPANDIHFNLDGPGDQPINPWAAAQEGASSNPRATSWELAQIRNNPQWWNRITFWQNGQIVPNPFQ